MLIENPTKNVSEIAYECGFNNLSNFNRIFKKGKGLTPSVFRDVPHQKEICPIERRPKTQNDMKKEYAVLCVRLHGCLSSVSDASEVNGVPSRAPSGCPEGPKTMRRDAGATAITRTLYRRSVRAGRAGDDVRRRRIPTLYGLDNDGRWWAGDDTDLSDTKYLTGSHPAVCGWELSNVELDMETDVDGELFTEVRKHIIAAFGRGAVWIPISWRRADPVSGGDWWDGTRAVDRMIAGGENHGRSEGWLDKARRFHAEPQVRPKARASSADLPPVDV